MVLFAFGFCPVVSGNFEREQRLRLTYAFIIISGIRQLIDAVNRIRLHKEKYIKNEL